MSEAPNHARTSGVQRVVMVIQRFRPHFSGQGVQLEALTRALVRRGVTVQLLTARRGHATDVERCEGYDVIRVGADPAWSAGEPGWSRVNGPTFAARVFGHLQRGAPCDLVHVHALTDALYTSQLWGGLHDRPVLFEPTLQGTDDPEALARSTNRLSGLRRALYLRCDGYTPISPALEASCLAAGVSSDRICLRPQGVETARYRPAADRAAVRASLGLPVDGALVAFVGSLIERKGLDVLLSAWSSIARACPDAHLLLVGRDTFDDEASTAWLDAQLDALDGASRARLVRAGLRDDPERWLQAADVFAFPSRREGFGTVMVEAMACALPCVVAALPGITDFIFRPAGRTGVVVPQDDPEGLAGEVLALLGDPDRRAALGAAARAAVVSRFDIDQLAGGYLEFYDELRARRSRAHV